MYSLNPYRLTLDKFDLIIKSLNFSIETLDFDHAEKDVATLRDYKDCYFCVTYRKSMEGKERGVCDTCPVHKLAEDISVRRKLSANGCYKTQYYREMVRLAWWYKQDKSLASAKALITAIKGVKSHMLKYKSVLDITISRDI